MPLTPGARLGPYEIVSALGAGGMGEVYQARDTKLDRHVAIKVLPEAFVSDPERVARFQREAKTLAALNHPHIGHLYGLEESGVRTALILELVEGQTLADRIAQGPIAVEDALVIATQVAQALEASHQQGIVHRDLKPANIKLRPDGVVKVLDFGLARMVGDGVDADVSRTQTLGATRAGVVMGTPAYMSPEQARGLPVDKATDVWAFGCILYEMLAGRMAFPGDTFSDTVARVLEREPDWDALPDRTPPHVVHLLRRSLVKDARQRLRDIRDVRLQIDDPLGSRHEPARQPAVERGRQSRFWRRPAIVAIVGALSVIAAGFIFFRQNRDASQVAGPAGTAARRVSTGGPASANQEANEAFELAMQFQSVQNNLPRAQELLERALTLDPGFAEALRYHATNYAILLLNGYTNDPSQLYRAEEELRKASEIAPDLPGLPSAWMTVYLVQGRKDLIPWNQLDRALQQDPLHVNNRFWRGVALWLAGDRTAAQQQFRTLLGDRPLFGPARTFLGETLREEGDIAAAIRELEKVLEQAPNNISAVQWLTMALLDRGDLKRARQLMEDKRSLYSQNYLWRATWALVLAAEGHRDEALRAMDEGTLKFAGAAFPSTLVVSEFYALVGDSSKAIEWVERAVRNGDERAEWFRRSPRLESIRQDPRFHGIIESVELRRKQRPRSP